MASSDVSAGTSDAGRMVLIGAACAAAGAAAGVAIARAWARRSHGKGAGAKPAWYREQRTSGMSDALHEYCVKVGTRLTPQHLKISDYTNKLGGISRMCVSADEGQFLETMAKIVSARNVVEVGCFTGYGTLSLALGTKERVYTLDIADDHLAQARAQWDAAGVGERVEHVKGPAVRSMRLIRALGFSKDAAAAVRAGMDGGAVAGAAGEGQAQLVFVDADKASYAAYVEHAFHLLERGGLCVVDNTIWSGRVIAAEFADADTTAIRKLNQDLKDDTRWDICLLPLADGVTVLRKR
ncbi:hypothetical protein FNF31_04769 [Cafeteria roenbergensis]|uniref:Caffeoyl-CoA O-methyltransferase n=1 Tax=Cafeteria roenbergensis TaxID=33653 RepID=A0A5A8D5K6_CAFRO|nr:hypothetical protein FNF31_04769 [Cafeteria roenbergensis]